jgi:hypothetical protein
VEENGQTNIRKVFIVIVQKGFLKNNIVNMEELERIGVDIILKIII